MVEAMNTLELTFAEHAPGIRTVVCGSWYDAIIFTQIKEGYIYSMKSHFGRDHEIMQGPSPTQLQTFSFRSIQEYSDLLSREADESLLQCYFEKHPAMLLQLVGHCPMHCALITQPDLMGTYKRTPDFMVITKNSAEWRPILIEIENPRKRVFRKDGKTRSEFNHARDQLTEWDAWFGETSNVAPFMEKYGIHNYIRSGLRMRLETVLVYGRRSAFEGNPTLSKVRAAQLNPPHRLISFDRLIDLKLNSLDYQIAITIRSTSSGQFESVWIPETFTLGPEFADSLHYVSGIETAIANNPNISDARRNFLVERVGYWKERSKSGIGQYTPGDRE